jgi:hypothetical protein
MPWAPCGPAGPCGPGSPFGPGSRPQAASKSDKPITAMATIFTMAPTRSAIEYHADAPRSLWFPPSKVASWSKCPPLPYTRGTVRVHPLRHQFGGTVQKCLKCRRDLHAADFASACPELVFRISDAFGLRFHVCLEICLKVFQDIPHGPMLLFKMQVTNDPNSPPPPLTIRLWRYRPAFA